MPERVYILFEEADWDGPYYQGVYSTPDKALEAVIEIRRQRGLRSPVKWGKQNDEMERYLLSVKGDELIGIRGRSNYWQLAHAEVDSGN